MLREVVTTHLEMRSPEQHRKARATEIEVREATTPSPELGRFLYTAVGGDWYWIDRLPWSYEDWLRHLERTEVRLWIALLSGNVVGYFELERQPSSDVEILYFGLLPQFTGQGHGAHLLSQAVERAWDMDARRVWVHTCTLDGPHALANYRRRGFEVFHTETAQEKLPPVPPGPWPGSRTAG